MTEFVAVTDIIHGTNDVDEDGNYLNKTFKRGEVVSGLGVEHMKELWRAGSIAEKGSREDPHSYDKELVNRSGESSDEPSFEELVKEENPPSTAVAGKDTGAPTPPTSGDGKSVEDKSSSEPKKSESDKK